MKDVLAEPHCHPHHRSSPEDLRELRERIERLLYEMTPEQANPHLERPSKPTLFDDCFEARLRPHRVKVDIPGLNQDNLRYQWSGDGVLNISLAPPETPATGKQQRRKKVAVLGAGTSIFLALLIWAYPKMVQSTTSESNSSPAALPAKVTNARR